MFISLVLPALFLYLFSLIIASSVFMCIVSSFRHAFVSSCPAGLISQFLPFSSRKVKHTRPFPPSDSLS